MLNGINIAYSEAFIYHLPDDHPFPISKYHLIKEQLVQRGVIDPGQLVEPGLWSVNGESIHDQEYFNRVVKLNLNPREIRRIGLPLTSMAVNRARTSVAGTIDATREALEKGVGINIGGGTHHAFRDYGEGFCVFNDIAVAAGNVLQAGTTDKIMVVDLDVHQGNGTAAIFTDDPRVFTFSMHGQKNYPFKKVPSDLDISLPSQTGDYEYLSLLSQNLNCIINRFKPQFVYYQAGVDVLASDKLGHLGLSKNGCKNRDEIVLKACYDFEIPVVITLGGGYSPRIAEVVDAHCNTLSLAMDIFNY